MKIPILVITVFIIGFGFIAGCTTQTAPKVVDTTQIITPEPTLISTPASLTNTKTEVNAEEFATLMPDTCNNFSQLSGGDEINTKLYVTLCVLEGQRRQVSDSSLSTYTPSQRDDEFFIDEIRKGCQNAVALESAANDQMNKGWSGYATNPYSPFATITRQYISCLDSVDGTPDSCQHILFSERTREVLSTPIAFEYSDSMKQFGIS